MKLATILLANAAEQRDGLLYVLGGGWDTVWVAPGNPPSFKGSLVVRLLAQRAECNRQHPVEIYCDGEDGQRVFGFQLPVTPVVPQDFPVAWEVPVQIVADVAGVLPRLGLYSISVLSDGAFIGSLPLRAAAGPPPGFGALPFGPAGQGPGAPG